MVDAQGVVELELGGDAADPPLIAVGLHALPVKAYFRLNEQEGYHWGMMRSAWASVADLAVMQFQDLLGLGSEGRMNTPSTLNGRPDPAHAGGPPGLAAHAEGGAGTVTGRRRWAR